MWRSRTFWRLFGVYGTFLLCAIGMLGVVIGGRVEQSYVHQQEDTLRAKAVLLAAAVRGKPAELPLLAEAKTLGKEIGARITLIDADGKVLADSEADARRMENHADRPEVLAARSAGVGSSRRRHSATLDQEMMYVALRTDDPGGAVAYVRVALPLDAVQGQLAELRRIVWTAAALTALAAMILTFWLARGFARPLQELTAAAECIAAGKYGHKIYAIRQDEAGMLAQAFNHMSERLADQFVQLEEDRQQLRAVLSGMVEGVIAIDAQQRILFANERAAQLLEFQIQAAVGRKLWQVVRQRSLHEVVHKALASSEPSQEELSWNSPGARNVTVHAARLPGVPVRGAVLVLHDTSELRRLERLRRDFVANVSHELKTPLSVIKACVETLLDGAVDDREHRGPFLQQVAEQADHLHALILDLISLGRIESGEEAFAFESVPLEPVVSACVERHRARAEAKNQRLDAQQQLPTKAPEHASSGQLTGSQNGKDSEGSSMGQLPAPAATAGAPAEAWADEEAVRQILDNLVDNALKYTPPGGRISVRWWAEDGQLCLEVEDSGIGIPEHDLPRIFERFYRVDKARSRAMGGTGLGLSIVKHLVQAMHGTVCATSRLGQGTTFSIRLPRAPAG